MYNRQICKHNLKQTCQVFQCQGHFINCQTCQVSSTMLPIRLISFGFADIFVLIIKCVQIIERLKL